MSAEVSITITAVDSASEALERVRDTLQEIQGMSGAGTAVGGGISSGLGDVGESAGAAGMSLTSLIGPIVGVAYSINGLIRGLMQYTSYQNQLQTATEKQAKTQENLTEFLNKYAPTAENAAAVTAYNNQQHQNAIAIFGGENAEMSAATKLMQENNAEQARMHGAKGTYITLAQAQNKIDAEALGLYQQNSDAKRMVTKDTDEMNFSLGKIALYSVATGGSILAATAILSKFGIITIGAAGAEEAFTAAMGGSVAPTILAGSSVGLLGVGIGAFVTSSIDAVLAGRGLHDTFSDLNTQFQSTEPNLAKITEDIYTLGQGPVGLIGQGIRGFAAGMGVPLPGMAETLSVDTSGAMAAIQGVTDAISGVASKKVNVTATVEGLPDLERASGTEAELQDKTVDVEINVNTNYSESGIIAGYRAGGGGYSAGGYSGFGGWISGYEMIGSVPGSSGPDGGSPYSYQFGGGVPRDMVARLDRGEEVITAENVKKLSDIFRGTGQGAPRSISIQTTIPIQLDGREIMRYVQRQMLQDKLSGSAYT